MPEIAAISQIRCNLGEGPLWHPQHEQLFVTDIFAKKIHVLDADLNCLRIVASERIVSAMAWMEDGSTLLFHDRGGISRLDTCDNIRQILPELPDEANGRFNDVIVDPSGRVWAGTEPTKSHPGRLYRIDHDLNWEILLADAKEPNGMGFSTDARHLYFTDSGQQEIQRFDFDIDRGAISNPRRLFQSTGIALPDGLTVDNTGNVWCALWGGGQILCMNPQRKLLRTVYLPAKFASSLTFGGPGFQSIFVTSAREDAAPGQPGKFDGAIFRIDHCGTGRAEFAAKLCTRGIR